jgi:hypothetical protein
LLAGEFFRQYKASLTTQCLLFRLGHNATDFNRG